MTTPSDNIPSAEDVRHQVNSMIEHVIVQLHSQYLQFPSGLREYLKAEYYAGNRSMTGLFSRGKAYIERNTVE